MNDAVYRIVEHDGGWAYKLGDVFSETFATRQAAEEAAARVAREQRTPGEDAAISWEDASGVWHDEAARGGDRPNAYVETSGGTPAHAGSNAHRPTSTSAAADLGDYAVSAYDHGDRYLRSGGHAARERVRSQPLIALSAAAACGFVLGLLVHKRHKGARQD